MDDHLIEALNKGDHRAFEELYLIHLNKVIFFAYQYLKDMNEAREVANEVFLILWDNRASIKADKNIVSYLLTVTRNMCLNILKRHQIKARYMSKLFYDEKSLNYEVLSDRTSELLLSNEVYNKLLKALDKMPEKTKRAFIQSRLKYMNYKEIAREQGVSEKNIEYRIGQALSILRDELKDFIE